VNLKTDGCLCYTAAMADLSAVQTAIEAALAQNAVGGVRSYTDGSLQVNLEAIKDLLDVQERLETKAKRALGRSSSAQVEVVV